jgi:glycosyltransferase involved in cell wall biosynthesis
MFSKNGLLQVGTLCLFVTVAIILFYDAKMTNKVYISPEVSKRLSYDTWETYDEAKALTPTKAKSRSVMLLHGYVPFWNAGSEVCAHTVNRMLVEKGHEVWVGVPGYPNRIYEGVHIFDADNRTLLHNLMKHTHVISTHSFRERCQKLSNSYGSAYIDWLHGGTFTMNVRKSMKDKNVKTFAVFNSESLVETFTDAEQVNHHILRPPVDWKEYEVKDMEPKYVTLSNLNENKGGQILIDIAKVTPEVQFLGVRGSYWKQIEDPTVANITYIDNTPKIKDVYKQTKILIMPSKEETWGRTAVEAMSSGIPVIAHPTPGLKECCMDAALFVDRNDTAEWSRLINRLMNDKSFYDEFSNRGRIRAKQLEPTHDLEMFQEWFEKTVVPSCEFKSANPPTALQKFLDVI